MTLWGRFGARGERRPQRGAALLEFAFAGGLFIFLLLGMFEFGYAFMTRESMIHAAQEALRAAIVQDTDYARCQNLASIPFGRLNSIVNAKSLTVTLSNYSTAASATGSAPPCDPNGTFAPCNDTSGNPLPNTECLTIDISYDYRANSPVSAPGITNLIPSLVHISATEQVPLPTASGGGGGGNPTPSPPPPSPVTSLTIPPTTLPVTVPTTLPVTVPTTQPTVPTTQPTVPTTQPTVPTTQPTVPTTQPGPPVP